jgi:hypothetical protein
VDICPWDRAELPEWQEALRAACRQWQLDAAEALAAGGARAEALQDLAEESEQYLWAGGRLPLAASGELWNASVRGCGEQTLGCVLQCWSLVEFPTSILLRSLH